MNHQNFIENWAKIQNREEQLAYLKNYMLSLDGDSLFEWMTQTSESMFSSIQKQLQDKTLTLEKRNEIENFLDSLSNLLSLKKAA